MADLLSQHASLGSIRKIGEGTFGEAFKADQVRGVAVRSEAVQGSVQLFLLSAFGPTGPANLASRTSPLSNIVGAFGLRTRCHANQRC